jgi:GT2 family glycosyltransferase
MLALGQDPSVGVVGCALLYEDGTLQHGGHHYLSATALGHIAHGAASDDPGPVSALRLERECSGVTAACALLPRDLYLSMGGLSHHFPVNFNDVDFCLKVRTSGERIVWTPFARLYHFESKTRQTGVGFAENEEIRRRWGHVLDQGDPYWRYPMRSRKPVNWVEPVDVPNRVAEAIRTGR